MMKRHKLSWRKDLEELLRRNPDLRMMDDPEKLDYYRHDLNVDLPPLIRDLLLKSLPDLILQPTKEEHLLEIVRLARERKIPLTVRGAGTWGYGGAVPTRGGILVDLELMDSIEVDARSFQVTVGPGARFLDIGRKLEHHGLSLLSMPSGKGRHPGRMDRDRGDGIRNLSPRSGAGPDPPAPCDHSRRKGPGRGRGRPGHGLFPFHRGPDGHHCQGHTPCRPATRPVFSVPRPLRKDGRCL